MDEVLERLKCGVRDFQREVFPEKSDFFARAASEQQQPHTLFITCADSRIDPLCITSAAPGDIFVARNIGNMVPPYDQQIGGGMSAVIEYAVKALKVRHVVVCGHTQCGAMKALLSPTSVDTLPAVRTWLNGGQAAIDATNKLQKKGELNAPNTAIDILTQQNVRLQIENLKMHPSVAEALASGHLSISGWVYHIGSGRIDIAKDGLEEFVPVGPNDPTGDSPNS